MSQATTSIRRTLRQRRNNISSSDRALFDLSINQTLLKSGILLRSSSIASYLANDGEPSVDLFIQTCSSIQRPHYLPVLNGRQLTFSCYSWGDNLTLNHFSIPEPSVRQHIPVRLLTVVLMPLVGFDQNGHRLGMGGGYYDRSLRFMRDPLCQKKPLLIGIAYSAQMVAHINPQPWDIPLDAIVTEQGLTCFSIKAKQFLRTF